MLKLSFFVPESHLDAVKEAVFAAGAGRMGDYEYCCWQTKGLGQFRPLPGSDPHIGEQGKVEQVEEWKVELVLEDACREAVLKALKGAHPYEVPAFDLMPLLNDF